MFTPVSAKYRQISNVRRTKSQTLNVSRLVLQLVGSVQYIEARFVVENEGVVGAAPTGDAPLNHQQCYCLLRCVLYKRFEGNPEWYGQNWPYRKKLEQRWSTCTQFRLPVYHGPVNHYIARNIIITKVQIVCRHGRAMGYFREFSGEKWSCYRKRAVYKVNCNLLVVASRHAFKGTQRIKMYSRPVGNVS